MPHNAEIKFLFIYLFIYLGQQCSTM